MKEKLEAVFPLIHETREAQKSSETWIVVLVWGTPGNNIDVGLKLASNPKGWLPFPILELALHLQKGNHMIIVLQSQRNVRRFPLEFQQELHALD